MAPTKINPIWLKKFLHLKKGIKTNNAIVNRTNATNIGSKLGNCPLIKPNEKAHNTETKIK